MTNLYFTNRRQYRYDKIWAQYEAQKKGDTTRFNATSRDTSDLRQRLGLTGRENMHTPTPWETYRRTDKDCEWGINAPQWGTIAYVFSAANPDAEANAHFIVTACNSHQALVDALEAALAHLTDKLGYWEYVRDNPESPSQLEDAVTNVRETLLTITQARDALRGAE